MKNNTSIIYTLFLIVGDILALVAAFGVAYILRVKLDTRPLIDQVPALTFLYAFLSVVPVWILVHAYIGLYDKRIYEKRFTEIGRLFVGSFIGLLLFIGYDFVNPQPIFPARLVPVYGFVLALVLLIIARTLARAIQTLLFRYGIGITNILIVGSTSVTKELIDSLHNSRQSGYRIVGVVGNRTLLRKYSEHVPLFGSFSEACKSIQSSNIYSILQTELYAEPERNNEILGYAQNNHISYRFVPGNSELFFGNIDVELFRSSIPVVSVHQTPLNGWGQVVKRLFDVTLALLLLIITSPIMLVIMLLLVGSGGKVFFRQTRLTRFNNKFKVFKFRSNKIAYNGLSPEQAFTKMGKPELIKTYRENGDQIPDDPRISSLGRFLRKTSLDELPQLFNVLVGDLSLVGPRALVPEELDVYAKRHTILSVKSGMTGLAQVSGRRDISFEERRKLDVYYVQNWSFWLDITILIKTVRAILRSEGAS